MSAQGFALQPFSIPRHLPVEITGTIERTGRTLFIHYALDGPLSELAIPEPTGLPIRQSRLWEHTCFELFVAPRYTPQYWEFNLSPSGHWNVYRFSDYRQGMQEAAVFSVLPFQVQRWTDGLSLVLETALDGIAQPKQSLEIGVSVVLRHQSGDVTYWALAHPGSQPDFHRRASFIIGL